MSPTFRPPLYHTSEVLTDSTSTPFARLTFTVSPETEHVDGVYQLWTDLPSLNEEGNSIYSPGEWHEVNFAPSAAPSSTSTTNISSATISLGARASPPASNPSLYAIIHIPSHPASYSYTLRQAKASGEIVWLGSDGSNGTVIVKQGEASTEVVIEAGTWDGTLKHMEDIAWSGVAVVTPSEDGPTPPSIVQLPTAETVTASLVVAVGIKPTESIPFFQLTSDTKSNSITRNIAMAVAGSSNKTLDCSPNNVLPAKSRQGTFGRSESGSLPSAVQKALAEQSSPAFNIIDSGDSHVVLAPARAERNANTNLVLLAYSLGNPQTVTVKVPSQVESTSPILCQIAASRQLLRAKSSQSSIDVQLGAGLVADVFRFTEMSELRVAGGDDSIWICAPSAESVQVGEEEIGEIVTDGGGGEKEATAPVAASEYSEVASSAKAPSEADTELPRARGSGDGESEYEAGDEDESAVPSRSGGSESGASWFFRMLDSFLVRIWSWIFSPSHAQISPRSTERRITEGEEAEAEAEVETEGETAVESPADERTPLLMTPGLSRSTSTTFNSQLNSPESTFTVRQKDALDSLAKSMVNDDSTPTKQSTSTATTGQAYAHHYSAGSVTVRSYTQFTFTSAPPFTFYLPPDSGAWQDKVRFSLKTQMAAKWSAVDVAVKDAQGGAVEVLVGEGQVEHQGEKGRWQVQVERL